MLHAASQDLACLAEVGMVPSRVFDTELGGRLAGFERVGLGAMVENVLGLRLEKGHSAADWSTRPLPESWLVYAALDVEVLVELRDEIEAVLDAQGKLAWAHEEFEAVRLALPPPPRVDPWRRTSGMHRLRTRRQLAAVRALWEVRDAMARRRDTAPGRILPDSAIVGAVAAPPRARPSCSSCRCSAAGATRRHVDTWFAALQSAAALPDAELPQPVPAGDGPPAANRWAERDPVAAKRLARVRAVVTRLAEQHGMPPENLVQPDAVRRLAWQPPAAQRGRRPAVEAVAAALSAHGARPWQVGLVAASRRRGAARPGRRTGPARGRGTRRRRAPPTPRSPPPTVARRAGPDRRGRAAPRVRRVRRATSPAGAPAPRTARAARSRPGAVTGPA